MSAPAPEVIARLKEAAGPGGWLDQADALVRYNAEWRGLYRGEAALVLQPNSTEAVARIIALCAETGTAVVPQGGNTGLCGAAVAGREEVILSLGRMTAVRDVDVLNDTLTVEAGVTLARAQELATEHDRLFPLSLASEGSCQIGGVLSTNAGGMAVLRYGTARDLVLGLEVVLPDGRILNGLKGLRKDNTGYDLRHLFIGAEGTLGIITAAVLKLFPAPRDRAVAFLAVPTAEAAIHLLSHCRQATGDAVSTFELLNRLSLEMVLRHHPGAVDPLGAASPFYVLIEATSPRADAALTSVIEAALAEALERGWITDAVVAQTGTQADAFRMLREAVSDSQKPEGGSIKHDIAVPVSKVPEFLRRAGRAVERAVPGVRIVAFGHVGDGNVHYNLSQPVGADTQAFLARWAEVNRIVHDIVAELGGSFSAEHGIGRLKTDELRHYASPVELDLMRRIKTALDPQSILNPGKVITP